MALHTNMDGLSHKLQEEALLLSGCRDQEIIFRIGNRIRMIASYIQAELTELLDGWDNEQRQLFEDTAELGRPPVTAAIYFAKSVKTETRHMSPFISGAVDQLYCEVQAILHFAQQWQVSHLPGIDEYLFTEKEFQVPH